MKTFEELLNLQEPGWAVVQGWLREATNPVEVLPPVEANRKSALVAVQVTALALRLFLDAERRAEAVFDFAEEWDADAQ